MSTRPNGRDHHGVAWQYLNDEYFQTLSQLACLQTISGTKGTLCARQQDDIDGVNEWNIPAKLRKEIADEIDTDCSGKIENDSFDKINKDFTDNTDKRFNG